MSYFFWRSVSVPLIRRCREALIHMEIYDDPKEDWPPPFMDKPSMVFALRGFKDQENKARLREQRMTKGFWVFKFVDLVFVALLSKLSQVLEFCSLSFHSFSYVTSVFAVLYVTRMTMDDYGVHFLADDSFHVVLYFAYFMSTFIMTLNLHVDKDGVDDASCNANFVTFGFSMGFFASRIVMLILFTRVIYEDELWQSKKQQLICHEEKKKTTVGDAHTYSKKSEVNAATYEHDMVPCKPPMQGGRGCDRCRHHATCFETCSRYLEHNFGKRHHNYDIDGLDQHVLDAVRRVQKQIADFWPVLNPYPAPLSAPSSAAEDSDNPFESNPGDFEEILGKFVSLEAETASDAHADADPSHDEDRFTSEFLDLWAPSATRTASDSDTGMRRLDFDTNVSVEDFREALNLFDVALFPSSDRRRKDLLPRPAMRDSKEREAWVEMRHYVMKELRDKIQDIRECLRIKVGLASSDAAAEGAWEILQARMNVVYKSDKMAARAHVSRTKGVTVRAFREQLVTTVRNVLAWLHDEGAVEEDSQQEEALRDDPDNEQCEELTRGRDFDRLRADDDKSLPVAACRASVLTRAAQLTKRVSKLDTLLLMALTVKRERLILDTRVLLTRLLAARQLKKRLAEETRQFSSETAVQLVKNKEAIQLLLWRHQKALFSSFYRLLDEILACKIRHDSNALVEERYSSSEDRRRVERKIEKEEDEGILQAVRKEVRINMGWAQYGNSVLAILASMLIVLLAEIVDTITGGKKILYHADYKVYVYVCAMLVEIAWGISKQVVHVVNNSQPPDDDEDEDEDDENRGGRGGGRERGGAGGADVEAGGKPSRLSILSSSGLNPSLPKTYQEPSLASRAIAACGDAHDYYDLESHHYEERLREFVLFGLGEGVLLLLLPNYDPTASSPNANGGTYAVNSFAVRVYGVQVSSCYLVFLFAYQYYHVHSQEDEERKEGAEEEEEESLDKTSRFLSRWLHLLLSLTVFFTASALGVMYEGELHSQPVTKASTEKITAHSAGGSSSSGGDHGSGGEVKWDHRDLIKPEMLLATSVGTFVVLITILRSLYTHTDENKKIFRWVFACKKCKKVRDATVSAWGPAHTCTCIEEEADNEEVPEALKRRLPKIPVFHTLRLQPGKGPKLLTKLVKLAFALLHFSVGVWGIDKANYNIIIHCVLLTVSALTGGSSPWFMKMLVKAGLKSAGGKEKAEDLGRRISSKGNVDQAKNCKTCGIRRGIRVCQDCHAKEAPKGLRARRHAEHVGNSTARGKAGGPGSAGGSMFISGGAGRRGSAFPVPQPQLQMGQGQGQGQSQFHPQLHAQPQPQHQPQPQPQRRLDESASASPLHHPRLGPDTTDTSRFSMEVLYPGAAEHGDVILGENELVALPPRSFP